MRVFLSIFFALILFWQYGGAHGQTRVIPGDFNGPNGCGAADGMKVPDTILGCNFRAACEAHDNCYSACMNGGMTAGQPQCEYLRCLIGGDLFGSELCKTEKYTSLQGQAIGRKASCDAQFFQVMANDNAGYCRLFARGYQAAVIFGGKGSFNGMEVPPELRRELESSPESLDRLLSYQLDPTKDGQLLEKLEAAELTGFIPSPVDRNNRAPIILPPKDFEKNLRKDRQIRPSQVQRLKN